MKHEDNSCFYVSSIQIVSEFRNKGYATKAVLEHLNFYSEKLNIKPDFFYWAMILGVEYIADKVAKSLGVRAEGIK